MNPIAFLTIIFAIYGLMAISLLRLDHRSKKEDK